MSMPRKPRPVNTKPVNDRETKVLAFMRKFLEMNDQLPTNKAVAHAFGWKSVNAASEVLISLEGKGQLERNELGNLMLARAKA